MRNLFACLIGSILITVASSCSNKADDAVPIKSVDTTSAKQADIFSFKGDYKSVKLSSAALKSAEMGTIASRTYTNAEAYEIGRKRGAADVLALAKQFSYPCPNIKDDVGWVPPSPDNGGPPAGPTPNDTAPPLTPTQGGNSPCMDGYDRQRLDEAIVAWRTAALDHVGTSTTEEEQWYYQGYAQGVLEWELPPR